MPGPNVQEGQYDQYVDEWIPYNEIMPITDKRITSTNFHWEMSRYIFCAVTLMGTALKLY